MKIIVTESQYNRLQENNTRMMGFFQDLLNSKLKYIKDHCDEMDSEEYGGDIGFETCEEVKPIEEIKLKNIEIVQSKHFPYTNSTIQSLLVLEIEIIYNSIKHQSFDNIIWDMKQILISKTKMPLDIHFETTNIRKNFDW